MWINKYPEMIAESYEELLKREKRLRGSPLESRIKMLRLLKGGAYRSQLQLTEVLGYSSRHSWDAGGRLTDEMASMLCSYTIDPAADPSASLRKRWTLSKRR